MKKRKLKKYCFFILSFLSILFTAANDVSACSICFFGPPEHPMNVGLQMAIICLLLILLLLMMLFIKFFLSFRERAKWQP